MPPRSPRPERDRYRDEASSTLAIGNRQVAYEEGPRAGRPAPGSLKVAWTLRDTTSGDVLEAFAWAINPQDIDRQPTQRNQVHATRSKFYVDDFGPGPTTITLTQLVSSGKWVGDRNVYTAREDVQRFIETIYEPAQTRMLNGRRRTMAVYFHDNHWERGMDERVLFPQNGLRVYRSVDQGRLWLVQITMLSLERRPLKDDTYEHAEATVRRVQSYIVRSGDTLQKIARRLAGSRASSAQVRAVTRRILDLNPRLKRARTVTRNGVPRTVAANKVVAGDRLIIPA